MKTNLIFFTLLLITTTLTYASNNFSRAANGSYRMPSNKHLGKSRIAPHQETPKSQTTDQK